MLQKWDAISFSPPVGGQLFPSSIHHRGCMYMPTRACILAGSCHMSRSPTVITTLGLCAFNCCEQHCCPVYIVLNCPPLSLLSYGPPSIPSLPCRGLHHPCTTSGKQAITTEMSSVQKQTQYSSMAMTRLTLYAPKHLNAC